MENADIYRQNIRAQIADALSRARKLPVGAARNDLRQLAYGLRWLEQHYGAVDTSALPGNNIVIFPHTSG